MSYKIEFKEEECLGCGRCTKFCDNWKQEDGKVFPVETEIKEIGCNQKAADECPINIIKIVEIE